MIGVKKIARSYLVGSILNLNDVNSLLGLSEGFPVGFVSPIIPRHVREKNLKKLMDKPAQKLRTMCKSQYAWIYERVMPKGKCGNCSYDEDNSHCPNAELVEIYDPTRERALSKSEWYL